MVLLVVWQIVSSAGLVPERKLPAPTIVWTAGVGVALDGQLDAGLRGADSRLLEASAVLGYSRWERVRHVVLPGAASYALVGVRLGVASAWLALVVAETIATNSGIGYMINNARDFLRTDVVIVGLMVYPLVGMVMDAVVRGIEQWVPRWRR